MQQDSIQDSTRYVVADLHHGGVLPGTRMEMWREVFLFPGADVRGGVFCGSLSVEGPGVRVAESVYSRGAAKIGSGKENGEASEGTVTFESCFTCRDSLSVDEKIPFRIRFLSDLYTRRLNLSNAFVFGHVYADEAIVRNSVVLGGIFCRRRLRIEGSLVGTFRAGSAELGKRVSLFFPYAVARESIELEEPVRVLTFYTLHQQRKRKRKKGRKETDLGDAVFLDEDDLFELPMPVSESASVSSEGPHSFHCLSLSERILDSHSLFQHLLFNRRFIEHLSLGRHLAPEAKEVEFEQPMEELEQSMWQLVGARTRSGFRRGLSIEELFDRFDLGAQAGESETETPL